jgi:lactoylglutathione lyase
MKRWHAIVLGAIGALPLSMAYAQTAAPLSPHTPATAAPANMIVGPAFYVTDMARSLRFYRDALGMTVRMQFGPKDQPEAVIGFGTDPRLPCLMLLSDKPGAAEKIEHGHGYDRVALNVTDLRGFETKLKAAGYKTDEIRTVHGSILMMIATDPDGYRIELVQTPQAR